jgi:hypothetical protein
MVLLFCTANNLLHADRTGAYIPPKRSFSSTLTLPSPVKWGPAVSPPENFGILIFNFVHSDAFWPNLLIDHIWGKRLLRSMSWLFRFLSILTLPSPLKWSPGVSPPGKFWMLIFNFVHFDAFWSNLLIDYICEFCCNSFTVCNSLKAKGL